LKGQPTFGGCNNRFPLLAEARKLQIEEGDEMRFRFNVMVNGFVLVSVAVQSATAEALAHADILNTQGEKIDEADIASTDQGFKVALKVLNLSPREQSIHIETAGKCENSAFTSAGGHFNPTPARYGAHNSGNPHLLLGDLRSLLVGNNDVGILNFAADSVTLGDGANSTIHERGASLLVHAKPDNLMSDSSGNCGDRIFC
jgi:Cu-Zn family superoxide dismutase